ncbi:MAG: UvsX-like recombinase [Vetruanivirus porcinprimi]|uniref:UvsX-like recombinase n=1 Tax=phage Lak_Megaphage_RVC_AP1_GC26 TaxID=3109224 RepID=A0ABZ0Z807_9CAUD|nr:MAG: UvsX-like recombinase [phage Lak_Megaphage_RVC_AP1_GC26]
MAKKKQSSEDFEGGIGSLMSMVSSIDDQAEIIADSYYSNIQEWVPSGNYILNCCMSGDMFKALPSGRIVSLIGKSGVGKSFLACSFAREGQNMGYIPIVLDSEGAYDSAFVSRLGVDPKRMIVKKVNTILETSQFIASVCDKLQEQQDKYGKHDKVMFILDSLGNLTSEKEREDTLSGSQKADFTKAKDTKAMFRVCATPIAKLQCIMIVCNHVYDSMSFIPQTIQAMGSGAVYNASTTIELTAAKLEDKENDAAAKKKQGSELATKTGVLVTAKPVKTRFCIPIKVKFQICYHKAMNKYLGLEQFMNWENAGVCRGNLLTEKEYNKLSDSEKAKIHVFDFNGETMYAEERSTARGIIVKRLGKQVSFIDFWSDKVFTQEYLEELNEKVIHPLFQLPDQNSFADIKEIEQTMGVDDTDEDDPIAEATIE